MEGSTSAVRRGKLAAMLGVLFVLLGLIAVADVVGAPGQVQILNEGSASTSMPTGLRVSFALRNGGWVDVRADPVARVTYRSANGNEVQEYFYFSSVTVPAGGMRQSGGMITFGTGSMPAVDITVFVRVRGPLSVSSKAYRFP
jgi:hypothetical protein